MNSVDLCKSILDTIRDLLFNGIFRNAYRVENFFTRDRELSFENLFLYLLNSSKESMPINISYMMNDFPSISFPDISKQAISKARKGMSPEVFAELCRISVMQYFQANPSPNTWNGYNVLAIDGTSLQIPQTQTNLSSFGIARNQNDAGCCLASASICFDVLNDIVVDARMEAYCYGERKLASMHINQLECYGFSPNTLLIFDRGYPSYDFYEEIQEKNLFFLMRTNSRTHASVQEDGKFLYSTKDHSGPPIPLRMVHVVLDDGTIEKLVTNIFDPTITSEMFKELYFLRWGVESKYREFKNRLEIEKFTGCHPICLEQDFYISIFKSNLSAIIKQQADQEISQERIGKKNKYEYQANRGVIINRIHNCMINILIGVSCATQVLHSIVNTAKRSLSQIQPGRSFNRKKKMTRKKYQSNQKSCL